MTFKNMTKKIKILIIGNGFGGVYVLRNLHRFFHKDKNISLTMVGEKNYFLFTPLLHEVATGSINQENIVEPIRKVLGCCLEEFYLGTAEKINIEEKTVKVGEYILSYDYLIIASGSETNFHQIPGAEKYSFTLKSIEDAIKIKNHAIKQIERASHVSENILRKKILTFVVVGGGPTGVELAAELYELIKENFSHYYEKEIINDASIVLIQKNHELLPQFKKNIRQKSLEILKRKGIKIILNAEVKEVNNSYIELNDNERIEAETVIWVAGIKPKEINFLQEVQKSKDSRLLVNKYLQLEEHKEIFALGDITAFKDEKTDKFLPALAQVAEKEAKSVAKNIYLSIKNQKLEPFIYKHKGSMVSLGKWMAVGEIFDFTFSGHFTWWLWRTLYLSKLISLKKKIKVSLDWTINIFSPRDISEL